MIRTVIALLALSLPVAAQEQQAGNEASRNADATFQELVDRCNNTDIMVQRARIRVQLSLVDEATRPQVERKIDEAFASCGEGNIDAAVATMNEAAAMAAQSVDATTQQIAASDAAPAEETPAEGDAPWWKFW